MLKRKEVPIWNFAHWCSSERNLPPLPPIPQDSTWNVTHKEQKKFMNMQHAKGSKESSVCYFLQIFLPSDVLAMWQKLWNLN